MIARPPYVTSRLRPFLALLVHCVASWISGDVSLTDAQQPTQHSQTEHSQTEHSQSQRLSIRVPARTSVIPPTAVVISHDESSDDQRFPTQHWSVQTNQPQGIVVGFNTANAFSHAAHPASRRDARLSVRMRSSHGMGIWTVTHASDSTALARNDVEAKVQVSTDGPGLGEIALYLEMIGGEQETEPAGDYSMSVICTITSP